MEEYTSFLWLFGRKERANKKLKQSQEELLDRQEIEKDSGLNYTVLKVTDVEA